MEFTVEQQNELIDALMSAFPEYSDLEMMTRRELNLKLNFVNQKAKTYEETIISLIDWAEAKGKILELIISASRRNPSNDELQNFILSNLEYLLRSNLDSNGFELYFGISKEHIYEIIEILRKINHSDPIIDALFNIEEISRADVKAHMGDKKYTFFINSEGSDKCFFAVKILFLLELLKKYPSDDEKIPIILKFANSLKTQKLENKIIESINTWIQNVSSFLDLEIDQIFHKESESSLVDPIQNIKSDVNEIVMMVWISEEESDSQDDFNCSLHASLQAYKGIAGASQYLGPVDAGFDEVSSKDGKSCNFSKIDKEIQVLLNQSLKKILKVFADVSKIDFSVEVFLPIKWLNSAIELWESDDWENKIGKQHPISIRSYERFTKPTLRFSFEKFWPTGYIPIFKEKTPPEDFKAKHIQRINQSITTFQLESNLKIALYMMCLPPKDYREKFFRSVIISNLPIILWIRCESLQNEKANNWSKEMDDFLDWYSLKERKILLKKIYRCREKAADFDKHLGYHLSVLYDDPDRVPEEFLLEG